MEEVLKICRTCGESKPLSEFSSTLRKRVRTPNRICYASDCKPCASKRSYQHQKVNWAQHVAYRQTDAYKRGQKDGWLRLNYNKSVEWYESKMAEQGSVCAICHKPETRLGSNGKIKALAVDHDHKCCAGERSCGKCVRGLICESCNHAIGNFEDNQTTINASIAYLKSYQLSSVLE